MQRRPRTLALGAWLATRGGLAAAGIIVAAAVCVGSVVAAVALRGAYSGTSALGLLNLVSSGITWSAGMTLAFGAAWRAVARDREEGIVALARARGVGAGAYLRGRVGGLVVILALTLGATTLVASLAVLCCARSSTLAARATVAELAYVGAFAATIGPVAMAALGGRRRGTGYLALVFVLVVPELLSPWTVAGLPPGWHELSSIPAALAAVRGGVIDPVARGFAFARAVTALAAVVAVSLLVVARRVQRAQTEDAA